MRVRAIRPSQKPQKSAKVIGFLAMTFFTLAQRKGAEIYNWIILEVLNFRFPKAVDYFGIFFSAPMSK